MSVKCPSAFKSCPGLYHQLLQRFLFLNWMFVVLRSKIKRLLELQTVLSCWKLEWSCSGLVDLYPSTGGADDEPTRAYLGEWEGELDAANQSGRDVTRGPPEGRRKPRRRYQRPNLSELFWPLACSPFQGYYANHDRSYWRCWWHHHVLSPLVI